MNQYFENIFASSEPASSTCILSYSYLTVQAGVLSPVLGILTDKIGSRAKICVIMALLGLIACVIMISTEKSPVVWVATILFAFVTGYADLAIVMIPVIVGPTRAGMGYGVYAIFGNLIDSFTAYLSGVLLLNGDLAFLWFSALAFLLGILSYICVYFLERKMSFLERPLSKIVETDMKSYHYASMCEVVLDPPKKFE